MVGTLVKGVKVLISHTLSAYTSREGNRGERGRGERGGRGCTGEGYFMCMHDHTLLVTTDKNAYSF